MNTKERICIVCQKHYDYCPHCGDYSNLPKWHVIYCSDECRNIYRICDGFISNKISQIGAAAELAKYDLSKLDGFNEHIKKNILNIINVPVNENAEETKEEAPIIEEEKPSRIRRKRNKKIVNED